MYKYGRVDRLLPVVPNLVTGLYTLWSLQRLESIMLFHPVLVQTRFKPVDRLDIKKGTRQPIPVINGSYTVAMAPHHLLGMEPEYLVSMTSNGVGGGRLKNLSGSIGSIPVMIFNISIMSPLLIVPFS